MFILETTNTLEVGKFYSNKDKTFSYEILGVIPFDPNESADIVVNELDGPFIDCKLTCESVNRKIGAPVRQGIKYPTIKEVRGDQRPQPRQVSARPTISARPQPRQNPTSKTESQRVAPQPRQNPTSKTESQRVAPQPRQNLTSKTESQRVAPQPRNT